MDQQGFDPLQAISMALAGAFGGPQVTQMLLAQRQQAWANKQQETMLQERRIDRDREDRRFAANLAIQQQDQQLREKEAAIRAANFDFTKQQYEEAKRQDFLEKSGNAMLLGQPFGMVSDNQLSFIGRENEQERGIQAKLDEEDRARSEEQRRENEQSESLKGVLGGLGQDVLPPLGADTKVTPAAAQLAVTVYGEKKAAEARAQQQHEKDMDRAAEIWGRIFTSKGEEMTRLQGKEDDIREKAVLAARGDLTNGYSKDFNGSTEIYLKALGAGEIAKAKEGVSQEKQDALNRLLKLTERGGKEGRDAANALISMADSRPDSRPAGGFAPIGRKNEPATAMGAAGIDSPPATPPARTEDTLPAYGSKFAAGRQELASDYAKQEMSGKAKENLGYRQAKSDAVEFVNRASPSDRVRLVAAYNREHGYKETYDPDYAELHDWLAIKARKLMASGVRRIDLESALWKAVK